MSGRMHRRYRRYSQLEERVRDLEHEDVWVSVVVNDENPFHCSSHTEIFIVVLKTLKTSGDGGIFLRLCLFGAGVGF